MKKVFYIPLHLKNALNVIKSVSSNAREKVSHTNDQIKKELAHLKNNVILSDDKIINDTQAKPMENNCFAYNKDGGSSVANGNITFKPDLTVYNTVEKFKQFLAEQYNNGTPVIIVFPLVTSTSETVTGQTLTTVDGDNVLTITQASINNLPISAKYTTGGSTVISFVNDTGYITGIDSTDITNALGYTPVDPSNVGDGTITITQGGTTKGTFTVNQSGNTVIDWIN